MNEQYKKNINEFKDSERTYLFKFLQHCANIKDCAYHPCSTNKKGKFRQGGGRLPETLNIEEELIRWVCEQRRCEMPLTTKEIILKSIELEPNQKNKSETH